MDFQKIIKRFLSLVTGSGEPSPEAGKEFWDQMVRTIREKGGGPQQVSIPPGILFVENLYLWERAVMEQISGRRQDTPFDWFFRAFVKGTVPRALSVCCGTGFWERRMISQGFAKRVDAFDASEACLEWSRELAAAEKLDGINYFQADANTIRLPPDTYDVVICAAALHHIDELERILQEIEQSLRSGGLLAFDEYVGPNRMQWSDDLLEIVNGILKILPERYRIRTGVLPGGVKEREERVSVEAMIARDPTEAVRSEEIIPLARRYFDLVETRPYGGAILMPLFMNIIGNFDASREEDRIILDFCLLLEKILLKKGLVEVNSMIAVCRKRS